MLLTRSSKIALIQGLFFVAFQLFVFTETFAQTSDIPIKKPKTSAEALQFYKDAKAKGMSDEDIEKIAIQQGYPLEEITKLKKQLTEVSQSTVSEHIRDTESIRQGVEESPEQTEYTSVVEAKETIAVFGASFFSNASLSFEPDLRIATPTNYVVGPDDVLNVDIYGNSVDKMQLRVTPEGTVKIANYAPLFVSGLTLQQASQKIISQLKRSYAGLNVSGTYASVTLGQIRSIRITVTGEVKKPGTYTISSLATAFHALYLSGGPAASGSFRNIDLVRNNKIVRKIDLYKFLANADFSDNIMLQDGDVILIRPYELRVELNGEIKHPALFEALPSESLQQIISYGGGFTSDAYTSSIQYRRNTGRELKVGMVSDSAYKSFPVRNGDKFEVGKILERYENKVTVQGAVFRPGDYALESDNNTVKSLISKSDGLTENAFLNRAIIKRQDGYLQRQIVALDLGKLMRNEIEDIALKRNDTLVIKSIQDLKEIENVTISGQVIDVGNYDFQNGMTVADLIFQAGGFTHGAIPFRIEVSRRVKSDTMNLPVGQNIRIYQLNVNDSLQLSEADKSFQLQPYDNVFVRKSPRYEAQKVITVIGEVVYPGPYTVQGNFERISNSISKAGGLKQEAYLKGAQFRRGGISIALDLSLIMKDPTLPSNLLLYNGDTLIIPRTLETVEIIGQVLNPSMVNFDPKFTFKDYVSQAGGYTDIAKRRKVYVTYPNGRTDRTRKVFLLFRRNPPIEPGSLVVVPFKDDVQETKTPLSRSERLVIFSLLGTLALSSIRVLQDILTN